MPVSLLDSQLSLLELPAADETSIIVDGNDPTPLQVRQAMAAVRARAALPDGAASERDLL
jgi:gluconate kinase